MSRPFPTHTKIGQAMAVRGLRAVDVSRGCDIYTRTLSDILSGRKPPTPGQLTELSLFLRIPPTALLEDEYPCLAPDAQRPHGEAGSLRSPTDGEVPILAGGER